MHSSYDGTTPCIGPYEYMATVFSCDSPMGADAKDTFWVKNPLERLPKHSDAGADVSLDFIDKGVGSRLGAKASYRHPTDQQSWSVRI